MRREIVFILVMVTCALFFCAPKAEATLITIEISGEITYVRDLSGCLEGSINVGDVITGIYTYDTATLDKTSRSDLGIYEHYEPPCGIWLTAGGFDFRTDPDNTLLAVVIKDNFDDIAGRYDGYMIGSRDNLPTSTGARVFEISWELQDSSCNALSSDALPTTASVLDDWDWSTGIIVYGPDFHINANVTEAVPEPTTLLLLGLGGLALLRKRRA